MKSEFKIVHSDKRELVCVNDAEKKKEIELGIIDQERGKFVELTISNTMVSLALVQY